MRFAIIAGVLLLVSFAAHGQGAASLSCTVPTKNVDGSPLTTLTSYKWYWGTVQGSYPNTQVTPSSSGCSLMLSPLAGGKWFFVVTAIDAAGTESVQSNVASKVVPGGVPNPPTNLKVNPANLTAYGIQQSPEVLRTFPVGTVADTTLCDASMSANGLYRVPTTAVTYAGNVRPPVVFAQCVSF